MCALPNKPLGHLSYPEEIEFLQHGRPIFIAFTAGSWCSKHCTQSIGVGLSLTVEFFVETMFPNNPNHICRVSIRFPGCKYTRNSAVYEVLGYRHTRQPYRLIYAWSGYVCSPAEMDVTDRGNHNKYRGIHLRVYLVYSARFPRAYRMFLKPRQGSCWRIHTRRPRDRPLEQTVRPALKREKSEEENSNI